MTPGKHHGPVDTGRAPVTFTKLKENRGVPTQRDAGHVVPTAAPGDGSPVRPDGVPRFGR